MGWSCDARAMRTMKRISAYNGGSNSIRQAGIGKKLGYYEVTPERCKNGEIVGVVYKFSKKDESLSTRVGTFNIAPDGTIVRFPLLYVADMLVANIPEREISRAIPY